MLEQAGNVLAAVSDSGIAIGGAGIGCGLSIIGAGIGIGLIGAFAAGATARQPEASGNIFKNMIISAAFVEGVTFFSLLICFLVLYWLKG
jgi:F-type H+-transporting ATPase subunit c